MTESYIDQNDASFNASRGEAAVTTIQFHGDTLYARLRDGVVYVAIKPICEGIGLDWKSQRNRIRRDPILDEGGVMMTSPSVGGMQETLYLRLDLVNGWLFTIDEGRVKDEYTRQKVLSYKRECYSVLFDNFFGKARGAVTGKGPGARHDRPYDLDDGADIGVIPDRTVSVWLGICREARILKGRSAAVMMWNRSPLPPLPGAALLEVDEATQAKVFLGKVLEEQPGGRVRLSQLYDMYLRWCRRNSLHAGSRGWFDRTTGLRTADDGSGDYIDVALRYGAEFV